MHATRLLSNDCDDSAIASSGKEERQAHEQKVILSLLDRLAESNNDRMPDKKKLHLRFVKNQDVYTNFCTKFQSLHGEPCLDHTNLGTV